MIFSSFVSAYWPALLSFVALAWATSIALVKRKAVKATKEKEATKTIVETVNKVNEAVKVKNEVKNATDSDIVHRASRWVHDPSDKRDD